MVKILAVKPFSCTGCETCVLHCSFFHEKTHSPSRSRIFVVRYGSWHEPVICVQCGLCMNACPIPGAMKRYTKTGAIVVTDKCNGCGQCIVACPYGVIFTDLLTKKAIKCDLCNGNPSCVKYCPTETLVYAEPQKASQIRRILAATSMGRKEFKVPFTKPPLFE